MIVLLVGVLLFFSYLCTRKFIRYDDSEVFVLKAVLNGYCKSKTD